MPLQATSGFINLGPRAPTRMSLQRTAPATPTASAAPAAPAGPNVSSEARTALQAAMDRYKPGGSYGAGVEAALGRGRTQTLSSGMQNLVSSGLAGTTMAGGLGKKYEEEVAAPTRAGVESVRAERISGLQVMLAQMEQGGHQAKLGRQFAASESGLGRQFAASESGLGRQFAASESSLGRGFQASESALNRGFQRESFQVPQMVAPREERSITENMRATTGVQPLSFGSSTSPASGDRTPGSYVGSINGQRWIYSQQGIPVRA